MYQLLSDSQTISFIFEKCAVSLTISQVICHSKQLDEVL
jgi:hypothetical protein